MNNLTFGGKDPRSGGTPFAYAYYETIAGGTGAGAGVQGSNVTQSHMTNTLNTPIEVLEHTYPVRVRRYALVKGSGGDGRFPGGNGIVREIEMLTDMQAGILSDRRKIPPYGLAGGEAGAMGNNEMVVEGHTRQLPSKCSFYAPAGSLIRIQTSGGGGWGRAKKVRRKEKSPRA